MEASLVTYLLACLAIELTPGPNMAYLALLSADRGRLAGVFAVVGVAVGLAALALLAVFGAGTIITQNVIVYETLRWAGIAFLLYLAYDAWADARRPLEPAPLAASAWRYFLRGLIANLLNPKAILFYLTVMPNFVTPGEGYLGQSLVLAGIYVGVATASHVGVVLLAGTVQPLLSAPALRARMGLVFALMLVGVAVWLAFGTAR